MEILQRISKEIRYILSTVLHVLAMNIPNSHLKRVFYRMRGSKIGRHIDISYGVFLEEHFPEWITIHDNVDLGPLVTIVTHDSSLKCISSEDTLIIKEVIIEQNVYIGAGAILLPGVRIGHHSIIGAGSVVARDIPPHSIICGPSAHGLSINEWLERKEKYSK